MASPAAKSGFTLPLLRRRAEEESAGLPSLMTAAQHAAQTIRSGEHAKRRPGSGEKFWQFRDYQPGDRPQDIDWRQSAKSDRIFIRQKEWQTAQTALFWCAGGPGMNWRSDEKLATKRETALTVALGLAILMTHGGEQIGLLGGGMNPGRSELALESLGRHLLRNHGHALPDITKAAPRHANLVLVGDFLEPLERIEATFAALAARTESAIVIQTLDPAELELPFSGRVIFEDTGAQHERHHVTQVASIRAEYQKRIEAHIEAVAHLCLRRQWNWLPHNTRAPVRDALADAWTMLAPQRAGGAPA